MELLYKSANGRYTLKVQGDETKDLFERVSEFASVFELENTCGKCGSLNVRPEHRVIEKFSYYSITCSDCGAQFKFGQKQDGGTLFPKYKDDDGNRLPDRGWQVWKQSSQPEPAQQRRRADDDNVPF